MSELARKDQQKKTQLGFSHSGALRLELVRALSKALAAVAPGAGARINKALADLEAPAITQAPVLAEALFGPATELAKSLAKAGQKKIADEINSALSSLPKLFKLGKSREEPHESKVRGLLKATLDTSDWSSPRLILDGDVTSVEIDSDTADLLMCSIWCTRTLVGIFPTYQPLVALANELGDMRSRWTEQDAKRAASELLGLIARIEPVLRDKAPDLGKVFLAAKPAAEWIAGNGTEPMAGAEPAATEPAPPATEAAAPAEAPAPDVAAKAARAGVDKKQANPRLQKALAQRVTFWATDVQKDANGTEQRIALGPVLIPDVADLQGDVIKAAEIEKTADAYMEFYRNRGNQHTELVNDKVAILQSWTTPVDFTIGERVVKAGTWLMKVRYYDDAMWEQVKKGELTGFSIGGTGVRKPLNVTN